MASETEKQLRRGIAANRVTIDTTPATLRNACTSWLYSSWRWFDSHPQAVLKAWSQAAFKGWNLSYDLLNSQPCRSTVREAFSDDEEFALTVCTERPITNNSTAEEDLDGLDYDDDPSIDPDLLCDIRPFAPNNSHTHQLPTNVIECQGSLIYTGDRDLTDEDMDNEGDINDIELD